MASLLVTLIIVCVIVAIVYVVVQALPLPAPFKTVAWLVVLLIGILWIAGKFLGYGGLH